MSESQESKLITEDGSKKRVRKEVELYQPGQKKFKSFSRRIKKNENWIRKT